MRVLTNPIYKGYKRYYENKVDLKLQPFNSNYVIIPEETWDKAQAVCNKRKTSLKTDKTLFPRKSELLFSGLVSCGYCGKKLLTDYTVKYYKRKDGVTTKSVVMRYYCGHRKNFHTEFEHEVTQFGAKKYESESLIHINEQLSKINFSTFDNIVKKNIESVIENKKTEIKNRKRQLLDKENELNALESLRIKVELGQSKLNESHVENMMIKCQKEIENIKQLVQTLKDDIENDINNLKNSSELKDLLSGWNTIFPNADFDTQKMMLSKALRNISFKKDEIDLDIKLI
jgi:hypothetical protein